MRLAQMSDRLSQDKLGDIEPGTYIAGDAIEFALDRLDDFYLLRIEGSPEIFALKPDPAAMGGRVLKYDTGETAIRVAGWGGITFYSDARPGGLPVSRTGDSTPPRRGNVSMGEIQKAARDEAAHFEYVRGIRLDFDTDWDDVAANPPLRTLAFEAMENAARGLERFTASAKGRQIVAQRVGAVLVTSGMRISLTMRGRTLVVTFNANNGYEGRASSRAIAKTLDWYFANQRLH